MAGKPRGGKRDQFKVIRGKLLASTLDDLAIAIGRSKSVIQGWMGRGCPSRVPNGYDVAAVSSWAIENINTSVASPSKLNPDPADPLIDDGTPTEALERLRLANAKLSELKYAKETRELVPVGELHALLSAMTSRIRESGERLGRTYGRDAQLIVDEAIDAADTLLDQMIEDGSNRTLG